MARIALERAAQAVIDPANAKNTIEVRALRLPGSQVATERLAEYLCCENLGDVFLVMSELTSADLLE